MVLKPFVFLHSSPNAQDLIEGYNAAGRGEMEANYQVFQDLLQRLFEPHADALGERGLTPGLLAETVRRSAAALKYQATDEAHLLQLMSGLRAMIAAAVEAR